MEDNQFVFFLPHALYNSWSINFPRPISCQSYFAWSVQLTWKLKFGSKDRKNSDNVLSLVAPTCCLYVHKNTQKSYYSVKANWGYKSLFVCKAQYVSPLWLYNGISCAQLYGSSITSLVGCTTSLSPVGVEGQSPSQADWSPPEGIKQIHKIRFTSSGMHEFRDTWILKEVISILLILLYYLKARCGTKLWSLILSSLLSRQLHIKTLIGVFVRILCIAQIICFLYNCLVCVLISRLW